MNKEKYLDQNGVETKKRALDAGEEKILKQNRKGENTQGIREIKPRIESGRNLVHLFGLQMRCERNFPRDRI